MSIRRSSPRLREKHLKSVNKPSATQRIQKKTLERSFSMNLRPRTSTNIRSPDTQMPKKPKINRKRRSTTSNTSLRAPPTTTDTHRLTPIQEATNFRNSSMSTPTNALVFNQSSSASTLPFTATFNNYQSSAQNNFLCNLPHIHYLKVQLKKATTKFDKACHQLVLLDQSINDLKYSLANSLEHDRKTFKIVYRMQLATLEGTHNAFIEYIERQIEKIKRLKRLIYCDNIGELRNSDNRLRQMQMPMNNQNGN